jgi:hypothetical protein
LRWLFFSHFQLAKKRIPILIIVSPWSKIKMKNVGMVSEVSTLEPSSLPYLILVSSFPF